LTPARMRHNDDREFPAYGRVTRPGVVTPAIMGPMTSHAEPMEDATDAADLPVSIARRRVDLTHPDGRTVILIGVAHVAPDRYWHHLREECAAHLRAGGIFHLEGARDPAPEVAAAMSRRQVARMKQLDFAADLSRRIAATLHLTGQGAGLVTYLRDTGQATIIDTDVATMMRGWFKPPLFIGRCVTRVIDSLVQHPDFAATLASQLGQGDTGNPGVVTAIGLWLLTGVSQRTLVHDRNQLAISAAVAATRPVMLVWGGRHLPGMIQLLQSAGYRVLVDDQRSFGR
jgi:hypothetical protein